MSAEQPLAAGAFDIPGLLVELGKAIDRAWEIYRDYLAAIEAARVKVAEQADADLAAVDGKPPPK